jgi:ABC-type glycerol-3-phosphate transport system permease component
MSEPVARVSGKTPSRPRRPRAPRNSAGKAVSYLGLCVWAAFTIFIIGWVILSSLKSNREIFQKALSLPAKLNFDNYGRALGVGNMAKYFLNSVFYTGASVFVLLLVSAPAAYILARFEFRGVKLITTMFVLGMGIPYALVLIPLYKMISSLHLASTSLGLVLVYVSLSIPFCVYILTGFFSSIPKELEEAAIIDGCTDFQVYKRVMRPLAQGGIAAAAIFNGIGIWNEFQLCLVFMTNEARRTLALGLYALQNAMQYTGDWAGLFAGVTIIMIPTVVLYLVLSEKIISGITAGALK